VGTVEYDDITYEKQGLVGIITLNQPEKLNAVSQRTLYEIIQAVRAAEADDVRCLVVTGAGRGFCAGADLTRPVAGADYEQRLGERYMKEYPGSTLSLAIETLGTTRIPTVCAVNGVAVGAGLAIPLACDIRIASETARFCSMFTKRAMAVHAGMGYYLPRVVGTSKALEMLWTNQFVAADEAKEIGLVSKVVPADQLMPTAMELANTIASGPTLTIELDKKVVYDAMATDDLRKVLQHEAWAITITNASEDSQEGLKSFAERRDPVFTGR
jgi:2-(1,2-epoxy-1,2-dihydrophenyl)acetyl-CoA isomerase